MENIILSVDCLDSEYENIEFLFAQAEMCNIVLVLDEHLSCAKPSSVV